MMEQVSPAVRRFAAIGLAAGSMLAAWGLMVQPVLERMSTLRDGLALSSARAALLRELAGSEAEQRALAASGREQLSRSVYLTGTTDGLLLASLQASLDALMYRDGIRPQLTRAIPIAVRDGVRVVALHLTFETDLERLQQLLHRVESARPLMIVEALAVGLARASGANSSHEGLLQVELTIGALAPPARAGGHQ